MATLYCTWRRNIGYRSSGAIALHSEVVERAQILGINLPKLMTEYMETRPVGDYVLYQFEELKMYDSFPDVREFESFMDDLDTPREDDWFYGIAEELFDYIRIGEDHNDVEQRGDVGMLWADVTYVVDEV